MLTSDYFDTPVADAVDEQEREAAQLVAACAVQVGRTAVRVLADCCDAAVEFIEKTQRRRRASRGVPLPGLARLLQRFGGQINRQRRRLLPPRSDDALETTESI